VASTEPEFDDNRRRSPRASALDVKVSVAIFLVEERGE
jgi:hypothetical protein